MRNYSLLCVLAAVCLTCVFGQGLTSVNGTVSDPSGAVIPAAQLILENLDTGARRETTSDAAGIYAFPQVQPGRYRISAKAAGFAEVIVNNVRLLVNTPATVNVSFEKVGATTEVISVTADAIQVNTTDASLGNAVGTRPIVELPLFARNPAALLAYQPGVTNFGTGTTSDIGADPLVGGTTTIDDRNGSVNGGKSDQSNMTLDGVDVNDQQTRRAFKPALRVTLDSVQEFRTTTLNATADQGRASGAQVALVTRSGTNDLHGALWEYHRNTVTAANSFFNNSSGVERPALLINVFGGRVGGPIMKNRLFFFGNYEGRRDASSSNVTPRLVPSEELKRGIVRYLRADGSVASISPDELRTRIDPRGLGANQSVLQLLQTYPVGNDTSVGDGVNVVGFRFTAPNHLKTDTYISKFDWNIDSASRHTAFIRGQLQNDRVTGVPQFPGEPPNSVGLDNSKGIALGLTSVFRPNFISTFRYGFTRQGAETTGVQTASAVTFRNLDSRYGLSRGRTRIIPVHNIVQDFSYIRGTHDIRFGGTLRWISNQSVNLLSSFHSASGNLSWLRGTGTEFETNVTDLRPAFRSAYGDAVMIALGVVSQGNASYNFDRSGSVIPVGQPLVRNFKNEEYEWYIQDTWKVTRALTITAGLRHSLMPPVYEANGIQTSANISLGEWFNRRGGLAQEGRSQQEAGLISFDLAERGRPLYEFHKKNFAPRLSLAYSPQGDSGFSRALFGGPGRTSIRAGAGMFYDLFGMGIIRAMDARQFGLSSQLTNPASSLTGSTAPRYTGFYDMPSELIRPASPITFPIQYPLTNFAITNSIDDTIKPPYSMALNFTIQREFGAGFMVQGSYVGRLSRRSLLARDLAMPTDIKDPASGMTWYEAASQMARLSRAGVGAGNVPRIAYFENMWPSLATASQTASQAIYNVFRSYRNDETGALSDLDHYEDPACSRLGCNAFFSSQFSALAGTSSIGSGNYHAMQWTVRKRYGAGIEFDLNYTWSKSIDLTSESEYALWAGALTTGYNGYIVNAWQPHLSRGVSDYDAAHIVNSWAVIELPFGRSKRWGSGTNTFVNHLIGGWQVAPTFNMSSGLPFSVGNGRYWPTNWNITGLATNISPVETEVGVTKNAPAISGAGGPNAFADPNVAIKSFDYTLPGGVGDRNNLRGDGRFGIDLGVSKRFTFYERHAVQFRWETFNLTNTVRFNVSSVNTSLTNTGTFGKYTNTLGGPRQMQFALRYEF